MTEEEWPTPFLVSGTGRLHHRTCGVGGMARLNEGGCAALPATMEQVVEYARRHPNTSKGWTTVSAQCCGATPVQWLEINHPELMP